MQLRRSGLTDGSVAPTDGPVAPTDASVALTDGPAALTDASVAPTDGSVALTDGSVALTDASVALTDASVALTDASVATTDGSVAPTDASVASTGGPKRAFFDAFCPFLRPKGHSGGLGPLPDAAGLIFPSSSNSTSWPTGPGRWPGLRRQSRRVGRGVAIFAHHPPRLRRSGPGPDAPGWHWVLRVSLCP